MCRWSHQIINGVCLGIAFGLLGLALAGRPVRADLSETNVNGPKLFNLRKASIRQSTDGTYEIGFVRLDKKKGTLTFPGSINMSTGAVEYAVVHATGKVHESVVKTDVDPLDIHLARLLLLPAEKPAPAADPMMARELSGPEIVIWVQWHANGKEHRVRLEDLVCNTLTRAQMSRGHWIYSGSRVVESTFLAQRDGSIAAIIADGDALVNNPRPGRNDDEIWQVNSVLVPAKGTAVEISIEFAALKAEVEPGGGSANQKAD